LTCCGGEHAIPVGVSPTWPPTYSAGPRDLPVMIGSVIFAPQTWA
jgi:hypothetical protein